jgi:cell division protein ZapA
MLDDLEALRSKLTELNARVRNLREENQQLRTQLSSAQTELESARGRVSVAVSRVDELLARLPSVESTAAAEFGDQRRPAGRSGAMSTEQVAVTVLGREYLLSCRPEEKNDLLACARYVDQKMSGIRDTGKIVGADRIAVLAALQIAQELLNARATDGSAVGEARRRIRELNAIADEILAPQEKLF